MPCFRPLMAFGLIVGLLTGLPTQAQNNRPPRQKTDRPTRTGRRTATTPRSATKPVPKKPPTKPKPSTRAGRRPIDPAEARGSGRERPLVEFEITSAKGEPWGRIVVELNPDRAPLTVRNFLRYVDAGFYDGTIFHRVLPGFIIQGGGYTAPGEAKTEGLRAPLRNESRRGLKNERGTIAMARKTKNPHSAVCQFFINLADNTELDYPKAGAYGYCAFGRVIEGMDVVDRIAGVATKVSPEAQRRYERYLEKGESVQEPEKSLPLEPPVIKHARRLDRSAYEAGRPGQVTPVQSGEAEATRPAAEPTAPEPASDQEIEPAEESDDEILDEEIEEPSGSEEEPDTQPAEDDEGEGDELPKSPRPLARAVSGHGRC